MLEDVEAERMFPPEQLVKEAIAATEQDGIVFIDEVRAGQRRSAISRRTCNAVPGYWFALSGGISR